MFYFLLQVMYSYYASSCFGIKWPKWLVRSITTLQLTQMFANLALLVATFYCCGFNNHISLWPSVAMYTVYACLFVGLFRQKYHARDSRGDAPCANSGTFLQSWCSESKHCIFPGLRL